VLRGVVRLACEHTDGLALAGRRTATGERRSRDAGQSGRTWWCSTCPPGSCRARRRAGGPVRGHRGQIMVLTGRTDDEAVFQAMRQGRRLGLERLPGCGSSPTRSSVSPPGARLHARAGADRPLPAGRDGPAARESSDVRAVLHGAGARDARAAEPGVTDQTGGDQASPQPRTVETHISSSTGSWGPQPRAGGLEGNGDRTCRTLLNRGFGRSRRRPIEGT
jgi:hypothetical protein